MLGDLILIALFFGIIGMFCGKSNYSSKERRAYHKGYQKGKKRW